MSLNSSQKAAVLNWSTRQLVIAGAGSGKTTTLVDAIEYDRHFGITPARIAAITFTGSGAKVLRDRVPGIGFAGTLHGFMLSGLRRKSPKYSVLDEDDALALLAESAKALGYRNLKTDDLLSVRRDWWKNLAVTSRAMTPEMRTVAHYYHSMDANTLDYDSILRKGLLHCGNPEFCKYASIYVDEFQDSAEIDLRIYQALGIVSGPEALLADVAKHRRLFFVGDPNQSIYGFRGGRVQNIIDLARGQEFQTSYLNENYRSTPGIVGAAWKIVSKNAQGTAQVPVSMREPVAGDIETVVTSTDDSQAREILARIRARLAAGVSVKEIAVLARTNAISSALARFLASEGVPVSSLETVELPRDWKFAKRCLSVIAYPDNWNVALAYLKAKGRVFTTAEIMVMQEQGPAEFLGLSPQAGDSIRETLNQMASMGVSRETILDIREWVEQRQCRTAQELHLGLLSGDFTKIQGEGVFVGTVHASKGQEYDTVFLAGVETGIFPLKSGDAEEERRLMYVAITRAKNKFVALAAESRRFQYNPKFGETLKTGPSQFFLEIGDGITRAVCADCDRVWPVAAMTQEAVDKVCPTCVSDRHSS